MDMSPYYDHHDKGYYGSNVGLKDLGKILSHELEAFKAGATLNPLQLPLQAIYSAATTAVGLGTAVTNEATKMGSGDFSSLKDFFGSVFGGSSVNPSDLAVMNIVPGGCMGPSVPTLPGQSAPGTGSGAPGSGAPPKPGTAGAPDGNASGAGKDGMLVTTAQANPAAAAAAIEAQFRKDNQAALEKAQAEEKATQEKAAQEKAAQEKAAKEKAAKEKAAGDKPADDNAPAGDTPAGDTPAEGANGPNESGPVQPKVEAPEDFGIPDGAEAGASKLEKNAQIEVDKDSKIANEEYETERNAKANLDRNASESQTKADSQKVEAEALSESAASSDDVHSATKAHEAASKAQFEADQAKILANASPEVDAPRNIEVPTGLKALGNAAKVFGALGDVVEGGVGAGTAIAQAMNGQNRDATVTAFSTAGSLLGGAAGATLGALGGGLATVNPAGVVAGAFAGGTVGSEAGQRAGEISGNGFADAIGIQNENP
jgi:hypothetical protein